MSKLIYRYINISPELKIEKFPYVYHRFLTSNNTPVRVSVLLCKALCISLYCPMFCERFQGHLCAFKRDLFPVIFSAYLHMLHRIPVKRSVCPLFRFLISSEGNLSSDTANAKQGHFCPDYENGKPPEIEIENHYQFCCKTQISNFEH